jgi:D-alanyl-D-alanine dipeptidase
MQRSIGRISKYLTPYFVIEASMTERVSLACYTCTHEIRCGDVGPMKMLPLVFSNQRGVRPGMTMLLALLFSITTSQARAADGVHPISLSPARTMTAANMVDIRSLSPDIAEDIKYAGSDNFVGRPVAGYLAAKCFLQRPAATALAQVQQQLRARHLRLKVWDCYRPARAVADFVRWAHDLTDQRTKPAHYPTLDKSQLLGDYIAPVSGHSRGGTVDLTLERCAGNNTHCTPLDMGTDFDYFGLRANTANPDITLLQRQNRALLRKAMTAGGFRNYPMEWWHYTLSLEPAPHVIYDMPVR